MTNDDTDGMGAVAWASIAHFVFWVVVAVGIAMASGCASQPGDEARSLFDRLEFDDDECGQFVLVGDVDLNPIPLIGSKVHMSLEKTKACAE